MKLTALSEVMVLADGRRLSLRPLERRDRDGQAALFERLSPASRRMRYLSVKHELTARELDYFSAIDHVHHEAFAAVDQREGSIVGVSRYVGCADEPGIAEVAAEVADELHHNGIGTALSARVVQRARENGYRLLVATTLADNRSARALLAHHGFQIRAVFGGAVEFALDLGAASELALEAERRAWAARAA